VGLEAAGAAKPGQPGERIAGQGAGPLAFQPGRDAEPVEAVRPRGGPGRPGRHLSHQLPEVPLQGLAFRQLGGRQVQLLRPQEQQAGVEVVLHAGPVRHPVPVEHPFAVVVGGIAAQAQLLQQIDQPVVAGAHPLAAQIKPQTRTRGVGVHPPAPALTGLQQLYRQAPAPQGSGAHQPGQPRPHHHHVNQGIRHGWTAAWPRSGSLWRLEWRGLFALSAVLAVAFAVVISAVFHVVFLCLSWAALPLPL